MNFIGQKKFAVIACGYGHIPQAAEYIDCKVLLIEGHKKRLFTKRVVSLFNFVVGSVFKHVVNQDPYLLQEVNSFGFHFFCFRFELGNISAILVTAIS